MLGFSFFGVDDVFWREVGEILAFILAGVLGFVIPKISKKFKTMLKQRFFSMSLKRSMEIKVKLAEIKTRLGATRIYLYQFHNGTIFLGDHSFHKYSISAVFEVVMQGLSREIQNMQSIPMSKWAELITEFIDNKAESIVVGDHRGCNMSFDEADLEDVKYTMSPKTVAFVKVSNNKTQFVGLIAIHFDQELTQAKFNTEMENTPDINALLVDIKNQL